MTNVIQFPQKNFDKNTKSTVKVNASKKSISVIGMSIFSLVLALSLFNKKFDKGFNSPTQGMRGLASVQDTQFDLGNAKLIKLINTKNSRKIASLGVPSSDVDEVMFGELAEKFHISRGLASNLITSIERVPADVIENEIQFETSMLEKYKKAFGATRVELSEENIKLNEKQYQSSYKLFNKMGKQFATALVVTNNVNDLVSIKIK